jgi:hypothetical protein
MDLKSVVDKTFDLLEQARQLMEARDLRWMVFLATVFFAMIFMAVGATGLAMLMVGIYIMYFVTFR